MTARGILTTVACFLFCTFIQFAGTLAPFPWTIATGGIVAVIFLLLLRFFDVEVPFGWLRILLCAGVSAAGVAAGFASGNNELMIWWAPAAATAVSAFWWITSRGLGKRCHLCNRWLRKSVVSFECPRCEFVVCEKCWEFDHLRCRLCEQNRVPVFPPDGRWWDHHLGARVGRGRCQICQTTSEQADLRGCGQCGRTQCRECWDYANGQCSRCNWIMHDLPETLRPYMLKPPTTSQTGT
jgi:hypothetical protein